MHACAIKVGLPILKYKMKRKLNSLIISCYRARSNVLKYFSPASLNRKGSLINPEKIARDSR